MRQLSSVLAVTDLTAASDAAMRTAARLAQRWNADLHLFGSPPAWPGMAVTLRSIVRPTRFAREQARALDAQIARAGEDVPTRSRVAHTHIFHELIMQRAREVEADIIVLGRCIDADLVAAVAERSGLPTLVVGREPRLPLQRAVLPITSGGLDRDAIAGAVRWVEALHKLGCESTGDHTRTELELLQLAQLPRKSGLAAASIREAMPGQWRSCTEPLKLSWRAAPGGHPKSRLRALVAREDHDLIITSMRARRPGRARGRLTAANRLTLMEAESPVLVLPAPAPSLAAA
jgi:nucleotide-binding universal stress UspA family protein